NGAVCIGGKRARRRFSKKTFEFVKDIHRNAGVFTAEYPNATVIFVAIEGDIVELHVQRADALDSSNGVPPLP
ncbi:MAG: hypothetical protein M3N13_10630, partial [Candidatus Eremiobacteraeota bacterium]|nr:hypothetical protein [Candidatus Eremiobacteraeota bacterium]